MYGRLPKSEIVFRFGKRLGRSFEARIPRERDATATRNKEDRASAASRISSRT